LPDTIRRIKLDLFFQGKDDNQNWNPRLHVKSVFMPIVDFHVQQCINEWATDVKLLVNCRLERKFRKLPNISPQERAALLSLQEREDIVVRLADKNLGLVVMPKEWYIRKTIEHLSDTKQYVQIELSENVVILQVMATFVALRRRLFLFFQTDFHRQESKWLEAGSQLLRLPLLYLLPKVHKSPIQMRPIVASHSWVTKCISVIVDEQLKSWLLKAQVLSLLNFKWWPVIDSSYHLVDALEMLNENLALSSRESLIVSSADFSNLYGNIKFEDAVRSLIRLNELVRCDMPIRLLVDCVRFVLENNYFTCLGTLYRLTNGIAMGTNCAPNLANAILVAQELVARERWVLRNIAYFGRYLDDIFVIWNVPAIFSNPELVARRWLSDLVTNTYWEHHTFSYDVSAESVAVLDLNVYIRNNRLGFSLYRKPFEVVSCPPANSSHAPHMIGGVIFGESMRAAILSSTEEDFIHARRELFNRLRKRGYTDACIRSHRWFRYPNRLDALSAILKRKLEQKAKLPPLLLKIPADSRLRTNSLVGRIIHSTWPRLLSEKVIQPPKMCMYSMPSLRKLLVSADLSRHIKQHAIPNASAVKRRPSFSDEELVSKRPNQDYSVTPCRRQRSASPTLRHVRARL
jgi:hypothetical protein